MNLLITGGSGLVGKAIDEIKNNYNYNFIFLSSSDGNLTKLDETEEIFKKYKPDYVIHLAAKVGGLFKNMNYKVEMLEENILINYNVLSMCYKYNVKKVISCLSTCIFPDKTNYPINEEMMHDGPPHNSNDAYAYAKRLLEIHSRMYQQQYNKNFICIIPTNIYGKYDNFDLSDGHVIPALIHQCYLAKQNNKKFIVKGTGKPLRQFIYSIDLAKLIIWTLENYNKNGNLILSVPEESEVSIKDVATIISEKFNYQKHMIFDTSYSDGQYKKTADNKKLMNQLKQFTFTDIHSGISTTIDWFCNNYKNVRGNI